jgi:hypothetical protein
VEYAARTLALVDRVHIFQSEFFAAIIPQVAWKFQNFHWTPTDPPANPTRPKSLTLMRREMLGFRSYRAGVFIAGMEGIDEELHLFKQFHPNSPVLLIATTGGATQIAFDNERPSDPKVAGMLEHSRQYHQLFRDLLP